MFKFKQGMTVRDKVTGFTGVITCRCDYITGCNRYYLQPKVGDDGKLIDGTYVDEPALEQLDVLRVELDRPEVQPPG